MKLWLLEQTDNNDYDTYDSCVVVAETEEEAKMIHPREKVVWGEFIDEQSSCRLACTDWHYSFDDGYVWRNNTWSNSPSSVTATCIGEAESSLTAGTVVCASFNAGYRRK